MRWFSIFFNVVAIMTNPSTFSRCKGTNIIWKIPCQQKFSKSFSPTDVGRMNIHILHSYGFHPRGAEARNSNNPILGVMRRPPRKFTPEEKQKIILSCQKKSVPLHVISAIYGVSRASLKKWLKNGCERDAIHNLTKKRKMGRARKKVPETELELLKAENERLRAENALLKK